MTQTDRMAVFRFSQPELVSRPARIDLNTETDDARPSRDFTSTALTAIGCPRGSRRRQEGEADESRPTWRRIHDHLSMRARTVWARGLALVELRGRIDAISASALESVLDGLVGAGTTAVYLDMTAIEAIDSAGIRALALIARTLEAQQGRLRVRNPRSSVEDTLERTGLGRLLIAPSCARPRTTGRGAS
jgi:anti-anti-sigma factor